MADAALRDDERAAAQGDPAARERVFARQERTLDPIALARMHPGWFQRVAFRGTYVHARHLHLLHQKLVRVARGDLKRLLVFMPPGHAKSETISRYFPAWYLGAFPDRKVILTSYAHGLAVEHSRAARDLFEEWGRKIFGAELDRGVTAADRWKTTAGGGLVADGVDGTLTGLRAHVAIFDDPVKGHDEAESPAQRAKLRAWYDKVLTTRLEPGGAVIGLMTPWHEEDLGQTLTKASLDGTGDAFEVLRLPAFAEEDDPLGRKPGELLWPERFTEADAAVWRKKGPYTLAALYQLRPRPAGGNEWPDEAFADDRWVDSIPIQLAKFRVMALDPSLGRNAKSDYSAIVMLALIDGELWVDCRMARRRTGGVVTELVSIAAQFCPHGVAVETNGFQELLEPIIVEELARQELPPLPVYGVQNTVKKEIRIRRLEPAVCHLKVRWVRSPGTRELVRQFQAFPAGDNDDGPDAMEMAQRLMIDLLGGALPT